MRRREDERGGLEKDVFKKDNMGTIKTGGYNQHASIDERGRNPGGEDAEHTGETSTGGLRPGGGGGWRAGNKV